MAKSRALRRINQLVLVFQNARPFRVRDLSDLFGALARDYRQFSAGRELIVAEIHSGSLEIFLRNALDIMNSINTVVDFGVIVATSISIARKAPSMLFSGESQSATRTVEKLFETAVRTNARVKLRYEGSNGEKLLADVKPEEARIISRGIASAKRQRKKLRAGTKHTFSAPHELVRAIQDSVDSREVLKTIAQFFLQQKRVRDLRLLSEELRRQGLKAEAQILAEEIRRAGLSISND